MKHASNEERLTCSGRVPRTRSKGMGMTSENICLEFCKLGRPLIQALERIYFCANASFIGSIFYTQPNVLFNKLLLIELYLSKLIEDSVGHKCDSSIDFTIALVAFMSIVCIAFNASQLMHLVKNIVLLDIHYSDRKGRLKTQRESKIHPMRLNTTLKQTTKWLKQLFPVRNRSPVRRNGVK